MTEDRLTAIIEEAVARAVTPLVDQILLLNERLGERALSIREMQALNGGRPSDDTIRRRIKSGLIWAVSERPVRVLLSEFERARDAGLL